MLIETPSLQRLNKWIQGIENVTLSTVDSNGHLFTQPVNFTALHNGVFWFFLHLTKQDGWELHPGQELNLQFLSSNQNRYISAFATAEGIYDNESLKTTWNTYFHDEDLVLVRAQVTHAEFWDTPATQAMETLNFAPENARGPIICPATAHLQ